MLWEQSTLLFILDSAEEGKVYGPNPMMESNPPLPGLPLLTKCEQNCSHLEIALPLTFQICERQLLPLAFPNQVVGRMWLQRPNSFIGIALN